MPVPASTMPSHSSHPPVEPVLEEVERHRTGRDEEHEDPDRPVREPVADLVARADAPVAGQLDAPGMPDGLFVGRGKQRPGQKVSSPEETRKRCPNNLIIPPAAGRPRYPVVMALAMDERGVIVACSQCGRKNRVPFSASEARCGGCGTTLAPPGAPIEAPDAARSMRSSAPPRCRSSWISGRRGAVPAGWSRRSWRGSRPTTPAATWSSR